MKKFSIAIVVACLMALTAGTVSADVFSFVDYQVLNYNVARNQTRTYTHDLLNAAPPVDVSDPLVVITDATLELDFSGTSYPYYWYWTKLNLAEIGADGVLLHSGTAASADGHEFDIDVMLLADGFLTVSVKNTTPYDGGWGDSFCWVSSTLSGNYEVVPVPGAVLLGVLGLGAAGMKLRRRNAA